MTEKEKMLSGQLYDASDPLLTAERERARLLFYRINQLPESRKEERDELFYNLVGKAGTGLYIEPPFTVTTVITSSLAIKSL